MNVPSIDPEHQLLLACALAPPELDLSAAVRRLAGGIGSWETVAAAATLNQLRPQVAARLAGLETSAPAAGTVRELEAVARGYRGRTLLLAAELARILDALAAAGIRAVPFKGPAFAALTGMGAQSREAADLDVLIDPSAIHASVDALRPLGYQACAPPQAIASPWLPAAACELGLVATRGSILLELHWRLAPGWCPVTIAAPEVLLHASARDLFGTRILWPAAEELMLMHVADGMKSGGCGIRWLGDLAAIARGSDLDWSRVRDTALRNGGLNCVRVALAVLDEAGQEAARACAVQALAVELPPAAQGLAREARLRPMLGRAVDAIHRRLFNDERLERPIERFRWALQLADHPGEIAGAVLRYLLGPAVPDLALMPPEGLSDLRLRLRALRRRLGAA